MNALVYDSDGAMEAAAAGFILLSMVAVRIPIFIQKQLSANHHLPDRLDFLLRLRPTSSTPQLHQLLRSPQRTTRFDAQWTANIPTLRRSPRNNGIRQSATANVHLSTAQRVRNVIARIRISGRFGRPKRPQCITTAFRRACADVTFSSADTDDRCTVGRTGRTPRSKERRALANRVPLPRESYILVRSQPGRRERDQLLQARDLGSFGRERAVVAGEEGERGDGYRAVELLDPVMMNACVCAPLGYICSRLWCSFLFVVNSR